MKKPKPRIPIPPPTRKHGRRKPDPDFQICPDCRGQGGTGDASCRSCGGAGCLEA